MYKNLSCIVVIAGAGSGHRANLSIPKQFYKINNKPIIAHTIEVFESMPEIDGIVVSVSKDYLKAFNSVSENFRFRKIRAVVVGGAERQNSVYEALVALPKNTDIVLVHDAVRPFVKSEDIIRAIDEAALHSCAFLASPVKDTIKIADNDSLGFVKSTPDRALLVAAQTPQCFKYELIMEAHETAKRDSFLGSDDMALTERLGYPSKIVLCGYENFKITTMDDLKFAELLLNRDGKI